MQIHSENLAAAIHHCGYSCSEDAPVGNISICILGRVIGGSGTLGEVSRIPVAEPPKTSQTGNMQPPMGETQWRPDTSHSTHCRGHAGSNVRAWRMFNPKEERIGHES